MGAAALPHRGGGRLRSPSRPARRGSDAKALATASPALVVLGRSPVRPGSPAGGRRIEAVGSRPRSPAACSGRTRSPTTTSGSPRERSLLELGTIGQRFSGHGPTLMPEDQPYGVRDTSSAAWIPRPLGEYRSRFGLPLRSGAYVQGAATPTRRADLPSVLAYRTSSSTTDPAASRPPLVATSSSGAAAIYDVCERRPAAADPRAPSPGHRARPRCRLRGGPATRRAGRSRREAGRNGPVRPDHRQRGRDDHSSRVDDGLGKPPRRRPARRRRSRHHRSGPERRRVRHLVRRLVPRQARGVPGRPTRRDRA